MIQGNTHIVDDVALVRESSRGGGSTQSKQSGRKERRASTKRARPARKGRQTPSSTSRGSGTGGSPEDRLRHIVSLLLVLTGILLLLALLSYSRLDQANADVAPGELAGLITNDPGIAARAQMTENWLGLVGAWVADVLINGTIGWFALLFPLLFIGWGAAVYGNRDLMPVWHKTLYSLGLAICGAGLLATISGITWTPTLAWEWNGAVGAFLATIFGGLLGSAGSFLLLSTGIVAISLYLFETDLERFVSRLRRVAEKARSLISQGVDRLREEIAGGSLSLRERGSRRSEREQKNGVANGEARPDANRGHADADHEPAHMIRRVREANPEPTPERSPVSPPRTSEAATPSTRPTSSNATPGPGRPVTASRPTDTSPQNDADPVAPDEVKLDEVKFDDVELDRSGAQTAPDRSVRLSRAPIEEDAPDPEEQREPALRVHVEERESDDDQEIDEEGNLIDGSRDEQIDYDPPTIEMLTAQELHEEVEDEELKTHARLLQEKLRTFNIEIEDLTVTPGPVVTLFEFVPAAGIKLSQIESLSDDIALALKARGIRIIAPIPGKGTVGVEIPNRQPATVRIRSVLNTTKFREADLHLPLALGKTTVGEVYCADLAKMPHLLIAGATGAGKSVGINSILASLLYKMHPSDLKLAIIDPKKIELTQYRALIDHYLVDCPDIDEDIVTDPQNAVILLKSLELEMDRRYDMLAKSGQRNLFDYNRKIEEGVLKPTPEAPHRKLPFIVLIIDELADLMITAAKEVEEPIARLAQLARAIGIHIIVATQRPSVDVLTGMIKANFPARIAYQVATKIDSRTILDMNGAEQLLGNGDMLYLPGGRPKPLRLQNAFITTEEVEAICEHIGEQRGYSTPYTLPSVAEKKKQAAVSSIDERDELFDEAARIIVRHQQGSVSLLQRRLKVGYARAARIVDELEDAGIVGSFDGSKARAVLLESEADLEAYL